MGGRIPHSLRANPGQRAGKGDGICRAQAVRKGSRLQEAAHRGRGFGKAILRRLAATAREKGCGRMEWSCLNWNTPSIGFYRSIGAVPMDQWTVYRLTKEAIDALAES